MHERFAQALQMQFLDGFELFEQAHVVVEGKLRRRAVGRHVGAVLDRAHRAAQIALPHRLDLYETRQRRFSGHVLQGRLRAHKNATLKRSAPATRQYTASGGMRAEV